MKYHCPECNSLFRSWSPCLQHLVAMGHCGQKGINCGLKEKNVLQQRCMINGGLNHLSSLIQPTANNELDSPISDFFPRSSCHPRARCEPGRLCQQFDEDCSAWEAAEAAAGTTTAAKWAGFGRSMDPSSCVKPIERLGTRVPCASGI